MRLVGTVQHDAVPLENHVVRLNAREGLSMLFDVEAEFHCEDPDLDLDAMLWTTLLVRLDDQDGGDPVFFHGIVEEAEFLFARGDRFQYRVRVRPEVHGLAYRVRSRIFQDKSATDVIKAIFQDAGIPTENVEWQITATYMKRAYCVQYKESELAFVLRLLEDEGIFYWFEHSETGHVLKFGDSPTNHEDLSGERVLAFSSWDQGDRESVTDVVLSTQLTHDRHLTRDWNFKMTASPLEGDQNDGSSLGFRRYEWPGGFQDDNDGGRRAFNRLKESLVERFTVEGRSNCRRMRPGRLFDIVDARPDFLSREYVLTEVEHSFAEVGVRDARTSGSYRAMFRAIPSDYEFRPARLTPKPRIHGKESAVVTGPAGEEIHVDDMGRIKVHFYWDREGAVDDTATCWIRTQQLNTNGSMVLPRIGWEVSVGFIDGDPDRPVVLQKLYNAEQMPPYGLPDNKTQGSLQSSTSPGGGSTNEIRLQDGNGGMEFFVHASKDFTLKAGHDYGEDVAVDSKTEVGQTLTTGVAADETVSIGAKQSVSVTGNCTLGTGADKTVSVSAMDDWGITGNYTIKNDGARTETIGSMMNVLANKVAETFNANHTRTVGAAMCINSAKAIAESVAGDKTEMVGAARIELIAKAHSEQIEGSKTLVSGAVLEKVGTDIAVSAKGAMAFSVGGAIAEKVGGEFTMGAEGVLITTGSLQVQAGGSKLIAKGGKISIKAGSLAGSGGPQLTLKGTINFKP